MNEKDFHDHHYGTDSNRIRNGALFRRAYDRSVRDFLDRTGIGRTHRVLSLGCGDGSAELRLAPHVGEIVGVDISPVAIEQARAAARAAGLSNLTFLSSDASTLRLDQFGEFDCVAAFASLHHLPDAGVVNVLEEARKVLRAGGVFYSSDPSSRRFIRLLAGLVRSTYDQHHSPDERELDPEGLIALASKAGFRTPSVGYHDYFFGPVAWLAPGAPRWLVGPLSALDDLALAVPGVRRYASSFSLVARAA